MFSFLSFLICLLYVLHLITSWYFFLILSATPSVAKILVRSGNTVQQGRVLAGVSVEGQTYVRNISESYAPSFSLCNAILHTHQFGRAYKLVEQRSSFCGWILDLQLDDSILKFMSAMKIRNWPWASPKLTYGMIVMNKRGICMLFWASIFSKIKS